MKKKVLIGGLFLMAMSGILAGIACSEKITSGLMKFVNVSVLADSEGTARGKCEEKDGDCLARCPSCNALMIADGHRGGGEITSGECYECVQKHSR